jgi:hypothetical protein
VSYIDIVDRRGVGAHLPCIKPRYHVSIRVMEVMEWNAWDIYLGGHSEASEVGTVVVGTYRPIPKGVSEWASRLSPYTQGSEY